MSVAVATVALATVRELKEPSSASPSRVNARPPRSHRVAWIIASVGAGVVIVVARWWTSLGRDLYSLWPDEPAQLAIARYVGGSTQWTMHNHSTWRPGYGTVLSPVHWFTDDPTTIFHSALAINALLGGIATLLLVLLGRRLTSLSPAQSAVAATVISISPTAIHTTIYVWSESLIVPLFLGSLLMLLRFRDAPTVRRGVAAGLLTVAAFGTHTRMLPLCLVVVAAVGLEVACNRMSRRAGTIVIGWTAAGFLGVSGYSEFIIDKLWDQPFNRNSYGGVAAQLTEVGSMAASLVGQSWYLLVSSVGLAGLGTAVLTQAARRRAPRELPTPTDARFVLVVVCVHVALSVIFMSDRWRVDQIVYGRYNDAVIGPVVLVGLATLRRSSPLKLLVRNITIVAGATGVTGCALYLLRGDELAESGGLQPTILGLQAFGTHTSIPVTRITAIALLIIIGLGLAATITRQARSPGIRSTTLVILAALSLLAYTRTTPSSTAAATGPPSPQSMPYVEPSSTPASRSTTCSHPIATAQTG